ncbi:MAG: hypothetical protein ABJF10_29375 [Chthoniobacter sp.]|uniref:hypothetical protein n=1 Tax=Chthoniobacter sp. TaxID=2510640 RepID=UPI0032AA6B6A
MKTRLLLPALFIFAAAIGFAAEPDPGFTVHEWGTFTSVQGSDGVQMEWNPLVAPELPRFVYNNNRAPGSTFKTGLVTRQRMETPVIYFYSDQARTADVAVRFPQGTVTEWYPTQSAANASLRAAPNPAVKEPALHWKQVEILPASAPALPLPLEKSGSHYYAARATDASLLRVTADRKTEVEKFLFYRGVGYFTTPLTVTVDSMEPVRVLVNNSGAEELASLFVYEVGANGLLTWTPLEKLAPGESRSVIIAQPSGSGADSLAAALRAALVRQGLYEKEAAAMVQTWESSWFQERVLRVLYTLPRAWTDRTLPLTITPAPKTTERVMVARAEIITPAMENALLSKVVHYIATKPDQRWKIVAETRALGMGRFTSVAMSRVMTGAKRTPEFNTLAWELANVAAAPPKLDVR